MRRNGTYKNERTWHVHGGERERERGSWREVEQMMMRTCPRERCWSDGHRGLDGADQRPRGTPDFDILFFDPLTYLTRCIAHWLGHFWIGQCMGPTPRRKKAILLSTYDVATCSCIDWVASLMTTASSHIYCKHMFGGDSHGPALGWILNYCGCYLGRVNPQLVWCSWTKVKLGIRIGYPNYLQSSSTPATNPFDLISTLLGPL